MRTNKNKSIYIISLSPSRCTYLRTDNIDKKVYKLEKFSFKKYFLYRKLSKNKQDCPSESLLFPEKTVLKGSHLETCYPFKTPFLSHIQGKSFSLYDFMQLFHDISMAIDFLHQNGLVHCDIAPRNLYVDQDGHYLLGDFSETTIAKNEQDYFLDQQQFATMLLELLSGGRDAFLFRNNQSSYFMDLEYLTPLLLHLQKATFKENKKHFHGFSSFVNTTKSLLSSLEIFETERISFQDSEKTFFYNKTEPYNCRNINFYKYCIPTVLCIFLLLLVYCFSGNSPHQEIPHFSTPKPVQKDRQQIIDCSHNGATSLVSYLPTQDNFDSVNIIYGEDNNFRDISEFENLPNLTELYLSKNEIHSLSDCDFNHLTIMILSDNNLEEFNLHCSSLSFLDLSGNQNFSDVSSLSKLSSLTTLVLTDTSVSALDISFLQKQLPNCNIII